MRIVQPRGKRGSLKWIQTAVNQHPHLLQPPEMPTIAWVSPMEGDGYAEYRDTAFLGCLRHGYLSDSLKKFWPQRGPQWDALGLTSNGPILVEAKAHLREFFSPPSQAGPKSIELIRRAFAAVQADLGVSTSVDWADHYFQYANRLAFLWWLRQQGIDAKLIFVSFLNDEDMRGPQHAEVWKTAFASANYVLGLHEGHKLSRHIYHVTPDVRELTSVDKQ